MIKPNLIYLHEDHVDVPTWRKWLVENRNYFNTVAICITPKHIDISFEPFLKQFLSRYDINVMNLPQIDYGTQDWRNVATYQLLDVIDDGWFISSEQDFFIYNNDLLPTILSKKNNDIPLSHEEYAQDSPYHICPTFCMLKKSQIDSLTEKYFGAKPPDHDHWAMIVLELQEKYGYEHLTHYGFEKEKDYKHMGYIGHNYCYMQIKEGRSLIKGMAFIKFLQEQIACDIEKPKEWLELVTSFYNEHKHLLEAN